MRTVTVTCDRCGESCGADMLVLKPLAGDPGHALGETVDLCGKCRAWLSEGLSGQQKAVAPDPQMKVVTR
jgi:hypothetical protein